MNFDFAQQINPALQRLQFKEALDLAENKLVALSPTEFHSIVGQSLLAQAEALADWVDRFYTKMEEKFGIYALYFELNEFDVNTDEWYLDGFAYEKDGGLDPENMEWISDWQADTTLETGTIFILEGYEALQQAFRTVVLASQGLQDARDWCEQIIIARFMELVRAAHEVAGRRGMGWAKIPLYFTEHTYDFIVRSTL